MISLTASNSLRDEVFGERQPDISVILSPGGLLYRCGIGAFRHVPAWSRDGF